LIFNSSQTEIYVFMFIQSLTLVPIEYTYFYKIADYYFSKALNCKGFL